MSRAVFLCGRKFIRSEENNMFTNRLSILLVLAALISIAALTVQEAVATSAIPSGLEVEQMVQSRTADAARWTAMGEYYQSRAEAESLHLVRARAADAARWGAMAAYYQELETSQKQNLARGRAADAARWTAMAAYYELIAPAR